MRNISFSLTTPQFLDGSKTVTRRMGWRFLKVGDRLMAVEKGMGLKRGEKIKKLGEIEVVNVWQETLRILTLAPRKGQDDVICEGFPHLTPEQFVAFFCKTHKGCTPDSIVTRIEFRRV